MRAGISRVTLIGLCVGLMLGACLDAHAFIPYRAFNAYQQLVYLKWSWGALNDVNNDGDISGANEGVEILVEGGANGFTEDEQKIVQEAFDVWQNVPTSYIGFHLVGPTADPLPVGAGVNDFLNTVSIQVPTDLETVSDVGDGVVGITLFTFLVDDGYYPDNSASSTANITTGTSGTGSGTGTGSTSTSTTSDIQVYVSGGQILEADIIVDGTVVRSTTAGQKPLASLKSALVHEIGHFVGLGHTPLNNLEIATVAGTTVLLESPVVALRDASNVLRMVGATPTMFPYAFFTDDGSSELTEGGETLAPDDIAGVSFLYPRGSQDAFFSIEHEARTQTRDAIPSVPLIGAHIVAWCDVDNDANTPRVPLFSTISGLYQQQPISGGRFALYGIYKVMETMSGVEPFSATYTFTSSPLNPLTVDLSRQTVPPFTPDEFMGSSDWGGLTALPPAFTSEVFHEKGNIFDIAKHDLGTAMVFDRKRNKPISVSSGKTIQTIRPWIVPMFGDAEPVCPWNVVFNLSGSTSTSTNNTTLALREFRDDVLLRNTLGSAFVDLYYHAAPVMAAFLTRHSGILAALRFIAPGVEWSMMHANTILAVLAGGVSLAYLMRKRRKTLMTGVVLLALALGSIPAFATLLNFTDEEIVRRSDDIVTGTVQTVQSRYQVINGKRGIVTDIGVQVSDNVKGGLNKTNMIYITILGGRVGNVVTIASEVPTFKVGQEVLLYLREHENGSYSVIAGPRGKFEVTTDSTGAKLLAGSSEAGNAALAVTAAKKADPAKQAAPLGMDDVKIPLEDYKAYLRGIVNSQKK